jgi:hypothetical protein
MDVWRQNRAFSVFALVFTRGAGIDERHLPSVDQRTEQSPIQVVRRLQHNGPFLLHLEVDRQGQATPSASVRYVFQPDASTRNDIVVLRSGLADARLVLCVPG